MMKTTKIILILGMLVCSAQWLQAQVKIGDRPLDIGTDRLLEIERAGELFIVTDCLEMGITNSVTRNVPGTDAMMLKLYGYGLGQFGGTHSYFLGTNPDGEVMEFPLTLDLQATSTGATLSLFNGTNLFGDVNMTQLDSFFSTNSQLVDSVNTLRTLLADNKASDLDTIEGNELITDLSFIANLTNGELTTLQITENTFDPANTWINTIDLNLTLASDGELADTAQVLIDLLFYKIDGTLDEDRTVTGDQFNLTFTDIDSFNVSSENTTYTTNGNTSINSDGTTSVGADGAVNITSTNANVTIDASTDSISMIGTVRLDEYPAKPNESNFNNILGIDADGNVINIAAAAILGTETDSVIYRHNGTLTDQRFMTMAGNNLYFVDGTDTSVIANNGRMAIGTGSFTPNSATSDVKLEVNGDILAIQVHSSSDRRFKKNIENVASPLSKVMAINGVTYDFRTEEFPNRNFPEYKQLGFIAQNVEQYVPEVVKTNGDGYKAVDYAKLTALLNEAIKEQQGMIKSQASTIEVQQELLTALASKLELIEGEMADLKGSIKDISNQTMSEEE